MIIKKILLGKINIIIFCTFLIISCKAKKQENIKTEKKFYFNEDSAYQYLKTQVEFGPRVPNTIGHKKCKEYLLTHFNKYTKNIIEQNFKVETFDGKILDLTNIIVSFNIEKKNRIFISAHWDTRPFSDNETEDKEIPIDGAIDGASGVSIIMELARIFSELELENGLDLILFDGEDYGQPNKSNLPEKEDTYCLGSQYWSKNKHKVDYDANFGILLDMVGSKNAKFYKEGISERYASNITDQIWKIGNEMGYGDYFLIEKRGGIIDDHYYINKNAQIPTVDIIDTDKSTEHNFGKYWHTLEDKIENVDKKTLKVVGEVMEEVIKNFNK